MSLSSWPIIMMLFHLSSSLAVSPAQIIQMYLPSLLWLQLRVLWVHISGSGVVEGSVNVEESWGCLFLFMLFLNNDILMLQIINHSNLFIPASNGFNLHLQLAKSVLLEAFDKILNYHFFTL